MAMHTNIHFLYLAFRNHVHRNLLSTTLEIKRLHAITLSQHKQNSDELFPWSFPILHFSVKHLKLAFTGTVSDLHHSNESLC